MILLDTDVLIDVALDRRPYADPASELLDRVEQGAEAACIAWHSVSNLYHVVAPALGGVSTRDFISELTRFIGVASTDTEGIRYAAELPMADFEDAMQVGGCSRLRGSPHSDKKRQGLRTFSDTCDRSPRCPKRTILTQLSDSRDMQTPAGEGHSGRGGALRRPGRFLDPRPRRARWRGYFHAASMMPITE